MHGRCHVVNKAAALTPPNSARLCCSNTRARATACDPACRLPCSQLPQVVGRYWDVERRSPSILSRFKTCSPLEVAAMTEGVLRHCTGMAVDGTYLNG